MELAVGYPQSCPSKASLQQKKNLREPKKPKADKLGAQPRTVTKGRGPGIFPGYYEHKPRLLS